MCYLCPVQKLNVFKNVNKWFHLNVLYIVFIPKRIDIIKIVFGKEFHNVHTFQGQKIIFFFICLLSRFLKFPPRVTPITVVLWDSPRSFDAHPRLDFLQLNWVFFIKVEKKKSVCTHEDYINVYSSFLNALSA